MPFSNKQSDIFYNDQTKEMFVCTVSAITAARCETGDTIYGALPIIYKIDKDTNYKHTVYPENIDTFETDSNSDLFRLTPACPVEDLNFDSITKPLIKPKKKHEEGRWFLNMTLVASHHIKNRIKSTGKTGILGVNIGPNKDTQDQLNDFCIGLKNFIDIADYITVNISSPNTEGLRDFHDQAKLNDLLAALNKIKKDKKTDIPLLLKISPDIHESHISEIVDVILKNSISAIVLTNTTNSNKDNLKDKAKNESGGLSGEPLQQISTNMIKKFYKLLNGKIPIIGVGGVNSGKSAYEKIIAGASLLQLYTGFVYRGPSTAKEIKKELIQILKDEGIKNIKDVVGKGS